MAPATPAASPTASYAVRLRRDRPARGGGGARRNGPRATKIKQAEESEHVVLESLPRKRAPDPAEERGRVLRTPRVQEVEQHLDPRLRLRAGLVVRSRDRMKAQPLGRRQAGVEELAKKVVHVHRPAAKADEGTFRETLEAPA